MEMNVEKKADEASNKTEEEKFLGYENYKEFHDVCYFELFY